MATPAEALQPESRLSDAAASGWPGFRQTAPPPLSCLPGGLCPTAGLVPLTQTSLPDLIQESLPLPALCSICTQTPGPPACTPQGAPESLHHDQQRNARTKQDWLSSGSHQSKFPFICGCPMRVLCFLYLSSASFQKRSRGSCLPWVPGTIPELSSHSKFKQQSLQKCGKRETAFCTMSILSVCTDSCSNCTNHLVESTVKLLGGL